MNKILTEIEKYTIYWLIFFLPLFILPIFPNLYDPAKTALLVFGVSLLLITNLLKLLITGKVEFKTGTFDVPVLLVALSYLISALFRTPNKFEAFYAPGMGTVVIASSLLYFAINQNPASKKGLPYVLLVSGFLLSLVSSLAILNVFSKVPGLPSYLKDQSFNPAGNLIAFLIYLAGIVPFAVGYVLKGRDMGTKLVSGVSLIGITIGIVLAVNNLLPGQALAVKVLDLNTSWQVYIESVKQSPFLGVGPSNYLSAFNRFRPISFNSTPDWQLRFVAARNFYLTSVTETGFLGAFALILLVIVVVKQIKPSFAENSLAGFSAALLLLLLALWPSFLVVITLLFVVLSLSTEEKTIYFQIVSNVGNENSFLTSKMPAIFITFPLFLALAFLYYYSSRTLYAEYKYKIALEKIVQNKGGEAYDTLRQVIQTNPFIDRYRSTYGQLNLALAQAIIRQSQNQKLSDADRNTVTQLIQQAIREGKALVALNPQRSGNWQTLGRIYISLMPVAKGSDDFALQTLTQAVGLDPLDPNLRISLGGIYYALGRYDEAIKVFELAVLAKPDFANSHYNLSAAYREKGEINKAISEMNGVLTLLPKDSPDYKKAQEELASLEKKKPATTAETPGETLTPPQKQEAPVVKPPIELPSEAIPPTSQSNEGNTQ